MTTLNISDLFILAELVDGAIFRKTERLTDIDRIRRDGKGTKELFNTEDILHKQIISLKEVSDKLSAMRQEP